MLIKLLLLQILHLLSLGLLVFDEVGKLNKTVLGGLDKWWWVGTCKYETDGRSPQAIMEAGSFCMFLDEWAAW